MKLIEFGFSEDYEAAIDSLREAMLQSESSLADIARMLAEANGLLLRNKRLLLRAARDLEKLIGAPGAIHIAEGDGETGSDDDIG